jgi:hypothetical protein
LKRTEMRIRACPFGTGARDDDHCATVA